MSDPREARDRLFVLAGDGRLEDFCRDNGIRLLVVFGSAVEDAPEVPPRDLDVAVLPGEGPGRPDWVELVTGLIRLVGSDDVDALNLARAGVLARANALGWGVPLYEDEPGLFARQQMAAMGQRMELGWLTDLDLELLAEE